MFTSPPFIRYSGQAATPMTTALFLNFTYHSMQSTTNEFELKNTPNTSSLKITNNQPPTGIDLFQITCDQYGSRTEEASERKRRILRARTKLPVLTTLIEYRNDSPKSLRSYHTPGSVPTFGEPLRIRDGKDVTLQDTIGLGSTTYVTALKSRITYIALQECEILKCMMGEAGGRFSVTDRLTASMSAPSPGPHSNIKNHHPAEINLMLETVLENMKNGHDLEVTFAKFIEEYQFDCAASASMTPVPAIVFNGHDEVASLARDLKEDQVRTRFFQLHPDRLLSRPMYHINNNPVHCGLNMFEILLRLRHTAAKLEKANPFLMCLLHLIRW
jgi:hypothetical protein